MTVFKIDGNWEGAEAGDLPRNRFIATPILFGSRGKVVALEKLRILSPGPKKCGGGEHPSNQLAVSFLVPRRALPEAKNKFLAKVNYSQKNVNFWTRKDLIT